ncbi:hypothetical protein ACLM5H_18295 [Fredinandcohnia humi]
MKHFSKVLNVRCFTLVIVLLVIVLNQNSNQASLKVKIENLQKDLNTNVEVDMSEDSTSIPELPYIQPEFLKIVWDKVILDTPEEEIVIVSKPIIEEFRNQFSGIIQTDNPYPGGFRTGNPSFTFHIYSGEEKYTFHSLENDFFMSAEMDTFYRSQEDYTQFAKAFLTLPKGYPNENLYSKLYHSGMIIGEKEFAFPILDSFRIKGIVSVFNSIEKKEENPQTSGVGYIEKFTFYYFGETYEMTLYDEYIHISDEQTGVDLWYKAAKDDISNILMVLRAG